MSDVCNFFCQVLMSDVRDVFFQLDPFEALSIGSGLGVAVEPAHLTIGGCDIHARWLSDECGSYKNEGIIASLVQHPAYLPTYVLTHAHKHVRPYTCLHIHTHKNEGSFPRITRSLQQLFNK
jgi:hypothetical protein